MHKYRYIAIEGTIGAGKTSFSKLLAEDLNAKLILEEFEENAFLQKFYTEPERYAFPLELSFLADRYTQLKSQILNLDLFNDLIIADYFIDKSLIFSQETLKEDELKLYANLFNIISNILPKPDLLVYLYNTIPQLQDNIQTRGRDYEQGISDDYLSSIQASYLRYFQQKQQMRIVLIDVRHIDFVHNKNDFQRIKNTIFKEYPKGINHVEISS